MDEIAIAELLAMQSGVISRGQVLAAAGGDHDIARLLRRRIWARIHDGVYVDHTGEPSWRQRAWAAVLYFQPAVLDGASALTAYGVRVTGTGSGGRIEIAIDRTRSVAECSGISVTRRVDFDSQARLNLCPPRVGLEHALLTVASRAANEESAVGVLADACQRGHTRPDRLVAALQQRSKLTHRRLLLSILEDVASGAYSVVERRYLLHVERPHRLPAGSGNVEFTWGGASTTGTWSTSSPAPRSSSMAGSVTRRRRTGGRIWIAISNLPCAATSRFGLAGSRCSTRAVSQLRLPGSWSPAGGPGSRDRADPGVLWRRFVQIFAHQLPEDLHDPHAAYWSVLAQQMERRLPASHSASWNHV
jgi:hypothetical protein